VPENRRPSRPQQGGQRGGPKASAPRSGSKPPARSGGKPTGKPPGKSSGKSTGKSTGKPARDGAGRSSGPRRNDRTDRPARSGDWKRPASKRGDDQAPRTRDQQEYDGPDLPENITGAELDRSVSSQLKGLPEKLASRVARHLAAAGLLIDEDPETAYRHTLAARARAPRLAVVREAAGEAAYASGHYAEALADLRAAKRMNGATAYLPIMADCHRALGQPEQAVKLAKSPSVAGFPAAAKAEMTIVEAGARRDMGQLDAALRTLELAPLTSKSREAWVVRLRYAYADTLEAAGRESDALAWFHRTDAIDGEQLTDAADRAKALEKRMND
jgi:tetratricopeptide (TPR) repeat protein